MIYGLALSSIDGNRFPSLDHVFLGIYDRCVPSKGLAHILVSLFISTSCFYWLCVRENFIDVPGASPMVILGGKPRNSMVTKVRSRPQNAC